MLLKPTTGGYGEVTRAWAGGVAVCIATGPSLTATQVEQVRAARADGRVAGVIVVNDAYLIAPWADVLYYADAGVNDWLAWHRDRPEFKAFAGQQCMVDVDRPHLKPQDAPVLLRFAPGCGLSTDPGGICGGMNSGHQALNLAALSGAATVLLLGYDGKRGEDGRAHFFGQHPDGTEPPYKEVVANMRAIANDAQARGIRIVNCTPDSAIDCFERGKIGQALGAPIATTSHESRVTENAPQ